MNRSPHVISWLDSREWEKPMIPKNPAPQRYFDARYATTAVVSLFMSGLVASASFTVMSVVAEQSSAGIPIMASKIPCPDDEAMVGMPSKGG